MGDYADWLTAQTKGEVMDLTNKPDMKLPKRKTPTEKIKEEIKELKHKVKLLEKMGEDTWPDDTVFIFRKQYVGYGTVYTYTALKIAGSWWLSGPKDGHRAFNWNDLVEFIMFDNTVKEPEVWVVSEWLRLV